jgi:cell division protein FtsI (penicillin-binding protein 3)
MDPNNGEILAMANWPTFNPNAYRAAAETAQRNRAIQDLYEPGSTFKVVTASAALDENVVPADALIDTSPGRIAIGSRVVTEASNHNYGVLSLSDVIVKSSNIGAIKIGFRVGIERFSRYVQRYGFGHPVSPDFPGESPGIVWDPARCTDSALASMAMGYQVAVTPLQMATAVSSVANGGELVEPRIVRAFIRNGRRDEVPHKVLRRTISPETAAELTEIMEGVVERGTAKSAQIPGYTIAGKTGTASKIEYGHYSKSDYNASFVGFVPSRKPALTIIVVIDSPHGHGYYGGTVAAPVFKHIAEAALRHIGVGPTLNAALPVLVARHDTREDDPRAGVAPVVASRPMEPAAPGLMPDLRGLSAREALRTLTRYGMSARMDGAGFVADQTPEPGVALAPGDECVLKLQRRPLPAPSGGPPQ